MGSPISRITAEIFLQNLEQSHVKFLLDTKHLSFYARYVDNILIIYDASRTNLDGITQYAGSIHHSLQFNPMLKSYDRIKFLDFSIISKPPPKQKMTFFVNPQPPKPPSTTYTTTQLNTNLQHTDTTLNRCSTSPKTTTNNSVNGKPSATMQKTTNSQLSSLTK